MQKHQKAVQRFYRDVIEGTGWKSEVIHRFITRFHRYKDSLFVFLTEDSIPWNNNTGERAIRHLAVQRKISGTFFKSFAPHYLLLLGIGVTLPRNHWRPKLSSRRQAGSRLRAVRQRMHSRATR